MNRIFFYIVLSVCLTAPAPAQTADFVEWKGVKIYEFETTDYPDTLEICGGEWLINAKATTLQELNTAELNMMVQRVQEYKCTIVYVDTRKLFGTESAQLYILGLVRK